MGKTQKQGLLLVQSSPARKMPGAAAALAAEMLFCIGLDGLLIGLTGLHIGAAAMVAVGLCLCLLRRVLAEQGRAEWFEAGVLAALLLATLLLQRFVAEGFRVSWNQFGQTLTVRRGWVLPKWQLQLPEGQQPLSAACFLALLGAAGALISGRLAQRIPGAFLIFLMPAVAAAAVLHADSGWLLLALIAGACLLIYGGRRANRADFFGWLLCLALFAAAGAVLSGERPEAMLKSIQNTAREALHAAVYETEYTVLPEGDLSKPLSGGETAVPGLEVEMSIPQTLYLRGFTGAVLEGEQWKALDCAVLAENEALLHWLNENAFFPQAQYAASAAGAGVEQGRITVRNLGACSAYTYVPFGLSGGSFLKSWNLNTDIACGDGSRIAEYQVVTASQEDIEQVIAALQEQSDTDYRRAESAYRDYVRRYYLQIPGWISDSLERAWSQVEEENKNAPAERQAQRCAVSFLSRCFPEEGTPALDDLPLPQLSGTSYQYATVAVMTLRRFGIPARYAEGYVLSAEQAESGRAAVDSTCARAWAEVYQEGIGWIPMELTPGLGEQIQQEQQESTDPGDREQDAPQEETMPESRPELQGGTVAGLLRQAAGWQRLLAALLPLALIFLLLWIRKSCRSRRRWKRFRDEDLARGGAALFADSLMLLEMLGFRRGNASPRILREPLAQRLGADFAEQFTLAEQANAQALFSGRPLGSAQYQQLLHFYEETTRQLQKELNPAKRVWLKWFRCVYG